VNDLPIAERWFRSQPVVDGITLLVEDHLDPFFESNVWHVRGRDRDLVVDTGNGIGDLRRELEPLVEHRPVVAVATHDHFDHMGGMHAFDERWCHEADANGIVEPEGLALLRPDFRPGLEDEIRWYGYEPPEIVITALPSDGFDVAGWRTSGAELTRRLAEGDVVDLGDRAFEVLHVPGHTAGSIALWDPDARVLFTGVRRGRGRLRGVAREAPGASGGARVCRAFSTVRSGGAHHADRRAADHARVSEGLVRVRRSEP
jgi:glyoxylase-like metal-dependent hydrolase (beta-lactamase superfamily II)